MAAVAQLCGVTSNALPFSRVASDGTSFSRTAQRYTVAQCTASDSRRNATLRTQHVHLGGASVNNSPRSGSQFLRIKSRNSIGPHPALRGNSSRPSIIGGAAGGAGRGVGGGGGGGGGGGSDGPQDSDDAWNSPSSSNLWIRYLGLLERKPISTKSITSMVINILGDLFCQLVVEHRASPDLKRLAISGLLGVALVGPTLHFWYSSLGSIVTAQGTQGAALRLVLDQFLFSPAFICVFFAALLSLEGRPKEIGPKLKQDWATTCTANWKIWIPFQFLNFRLVPPPLQVAAANVIALAWNVYLSFASHTTVEAAAST